MCYCNPDTTFPGKRAPFTGTCSPISPPLRVFIYIPSLDSDHLSGPTNCSTASVSFMSYGTKNYQEKVDLTESFCWIILTVVKRKMCNLPVIWEFASKNVKEAKKMTCRSSLYNLQLFCISLFSYKWPRGRITRFIFRSLKNETLGKREFQMFFNEDYVL